jgi:hypothetical protein
MRLRLALRQGFGCEIVLGTESEVHLKSPQQVMRDPIPYHLGARLSALLEHPEKNNSPLVDHIALSLQSHLYQAYSVTPASSHRARGGSTPKQELGPAWTDPRDIDPAVKTKAAGASTVAGTHPHPERSTEAFEISTLGF